MNINQLKYYFLPLIFLINFQLFAQTTIVTGKIVDANTNEPLPFVNISYKNSKIGTVSDINGNYKLETYYATDSLVVSFIGYKRQAKRVKKDVSQVLNFSLQPSSFELAEIEIKANKKQENPAHVILRNVIANKNTNNREKLGAYEYEAYNKIEFDINNIDESYKKKLVFKPFQYVFDFIDTSDKKPFIPIFITEVISNFYFQKSPKYQKEVIKAAQVSGTKNQSVQQFLGDMYQNVNVYDNNILVFGKSFVSPISDFGLLNYRYYLVDSAFMGNKWCYKLKFIPRRQNELTFDGEMWISDTTFAIKQIQATVSGNANINFISDFAVYQEYNEVEKEVWMLTRDELVVDFEVSNKSLGFYGRKTSTYKDFVINKPRESKFFTGIENINIEEGAGERSDDFWKESRHVALTEKEEKIYGMIDSLQYVPAFQSYINWIQMFVSGYKVWRGFEFGPYFTAYSFNAVEGHRFRLGGRTSNDFSRKIEFSGHLAYGLSDQRLKYGFGFRTKVSQKPRQILSAYYFNDVEQLGQGESAWRQDNIVSSVFRRSPFNKLNGYEQFLITFEHEWMQGLSNKISFQQKTIWPLNRKVLTFDKILPDGTRYSLENIQTTEVKFFTRFAFKEKYLSGEFDRVSLGTKYPAISALYTYGIPNFLNSDYEYHRLKIGISDRLRLGYLGHTDILLEGGKVWGKLPFPLLELHNGNETYSYDMSAFNLMNFYEFVSDEYVSLAVTHHFNGLFLNRIPLMNKLKWREVISAKGVIGNLNPQTYDVMDFPIMLSPLYKPYYEAGVGIENIFKFLRFDMLWRLAYIDKDYVLNYERHGISKIAKFGIRGAIQFEF
jgi:hypothetical protein